MKYDLAIFDMDGTLLDTLDDLTLSVNYAIGAYGYEARSRAQVRRFLGDGARTLITKSLPEGTPQDQIEEMMALYMDYYAAHKMDRTAPYPGISALLDHLKAAGMHLALISNKPDAAVGPLAEYYFPGVFEVARGSRDDIRRKPYPDLVDAALMQLGVSRKRAVYIGDSEYDIETAKNAGMDEIIVEWGYRDRDQLEAAGAHTFAADVQALEDLLLRE